MDLMRQGDYLARIDYIAGTSRHPEHFCGYVVNLGGDGIQFQGASIDELRSAFASQVGVYEEALRDEGREPAPDVYFRDPLEGVSVFTER